MLLVVLLIGGIVLQAIGYIDSPLFRWFTEIAPFNQQVNYVILVDYFNHRRGGAILLIRRRHQFRVCKNNANVCCRHFGIDGNKKIVGQLQGVNGVKDNKEVFAFRLHIFCIAVLALCCVPCNNSRLAQPAIFNKQYLQKFL